MPRLRLCFVALLLGVVRVHAQSAATDWKIPPLDGEVSGEITLSRAFDAPPLRWTMAVRTSKPRERTGDFTLEGPGARVTGEVTVDPAGEGTWRLTSAEIDLGRWFAALAPYLDPEVGSVSVQGMLRVSGAGTLRDGKLGGRVTLSLREGRLDDPAHKLLLEGISVDVDVADLAAPRTELDQVFTWRSGRYDVVALGVGRIEFTLEGEQVRVNESAIDVFGGELKMGSLVMSTRRPEFSVIAHLKGVAVEQMLFLLPSVLSEAKGRLDGSVALKRDATGVQIGDGRLALREGETADLRLAVKPGWLSMALPPEIVKYFPGFRKIETGEIPIRARVLEITFTPLGDAAGRTAWVHLAGGPSDPELTAPIDTKVNVRGPLEQLVKIGADLGTDSRLRFSGAK